ncbi:MAG: T9SS type A sorting domain-containing protein [Fluviicola sp.]|nr:T9SS type A sorting domain-containing protein [Fluviicola sp.]
MKKVLLLVLSACSSLALTAQTQVLNDVSIEGAGWTSTSTNFPTVICDANCGTCGGPCSPNTGSFYAWFGGAGGFSETGTLSQSFNVATAGVAALQFYLKTPIVPGVLGDSLIVNIDGSSVFVATPADSNAYKTAYVQVNVPLGNITAGAHTIDFIGQENQGATNNVLVDDISVFVGALNAQEFILDEYIAITQNMMNQEVIVETSFPEAADLTMVIYDVNGKEIYSKSLENISKEKVSISTSDLNAGVYMIDFRKANANPFSRSFTVVK